MNSPKLAFIVEVGGGGSYSDCSLAHLYQELTVCSALLKEPETTPEVRQLCTDLKVLGKSDFKCVLYALFIVPCIFLSLSKHVIILFLS